MSLYTTFETWDETIEYLKSVDRPQCFTVNYLPKEKEYALWIGNQPYDFYEELIEQQRQEIKERERISDVQNVHLTRNGKEIMKLIDEKTELQYQLLQEKENRKLARYELKRLYRKVEPTSNSNVDRHFKQVIEMLKKR
ncbi:hypothetical protein [Aneurinibacillus aneurinilyticus]|nr:hypothetical protein [Aneurinibacillus aneurinilyticus]MED0704928.1 hypothetical protein [Aneurinibacillus aneurinilyticus]MED0723068.1 hypothetical protein [Aneurinibacillus aneurinilyticus]MED0731449.1 hypothetical protein [Aneurinibacillus aneurinilyticus]MED0740072.1 hypothetical protein [Aneurinibacillus aneurinilyticus]